jgi:hypothetical protein
MVTMLDEVLAKYGEPPKRLRDAKAKDKGKEKEKDKKQQSTTEVSFCSQHNEEYCFFSLSNYPTSY